MHPHFDALVQYEIARHGANYGCQTLIGGLRAAYPGWRWPKRLVNDVLRAHGVCCPRASSTAAIAAHTCLTLADPISHTDRKWWAVKRIARGVYYAPYFMYSLHIDLACKLQVETIASCATHAYPTSLFLSHRNMGCMWALRSMVQRARLCI